MVSFFTVVVLRAGIVFFIFLSALNDVIASTTELIFRLVKLPQKMPYWATILDVAILPLLHVIVAPVTRDNGADDYRMQESYIHQSTSTTVNYYLHAILLYVRKYGATYSDNSVGINN